ncbi:MAG TPA: hypothetical protein PK600_08010, partial [Deltaproteobacteria bacterium]|nr:hypothetical protein [Deltaproteobacteria bacterium]
MPVNTNSTAPACTLSVPRWIMPMLAGALLLIYPFLVSDYYIDIAFYFGIYALLGLSLNIVLGEVGLFD